MEKYFHYCQTPDELRVDVAAMYLEGDAWMLFAWINSERTLILGGIEKGITTELRSSRFPESRQAAVQHLVKQFHSRIPPGICESVSTIGRNIACWECF